MQALILTRNVLMLIVTDRWVQIWYELAHFAWR